ncbi:MAG: HEPN domain-containing protein [Candidatus Methanoperedens sp.]|nr:HEPN domain-containing protein [Candidatus Methanoperedens sp.]
MKQFNFDNCVKEGLLRSVPPSKEKAEGSIKAGMKWLEEAEKDLKSEAFNSSVLSSYLAMFHSARSLLYFDGYREKSHYCIARYLEEKYVKNKLLESKWIQLLDHYRELRHDDQYSITFFATKDEAASGLITAKEFIERIRNLLHAKR